MSCIERSRMKEGFRDPLNQYGLTHRGLILQTRYPKKIKNTS